MASGPKKCLSQKTIVRTAWLGNDLAYLIDVTDGALLTHG